MYTIILYGEKSDLTIKNNLIYLLKSNYKINVFDNISMYHKGCESNDEFENSILLMTTNQIKNIDIPNSILIVGNNAKLHHIRHINKHCRMIVNSDNIKQLGKLSKFSAKIYTCGFSSKDYITFSSRDDDNAVVSLQRSVNLGGYSCEPFEMPCSLHEIQSDYNILATAMSFILIKCINESKSSNISKIYF